ncbi:hypothetical protein ABK040_009867 [Willaertia magna]
MSEQQQSTTSSNSVPSEVNGIAVGTQDGFIRLYHHVPRNQKHDFDSDPTGLLLGHTKSISALYSNETHLPNYICSGSWDCDVRIFNQKTMKCLFKLTKKAQGEEDVKEIIGGHTMEVANINSFMKDSIPYLVTGGLDCQLKIWQIENDNVTLKNSFIPKDGTMECSIWCSSFTKDNKFFIGGLQDGTTRGFDLETGKLVSRFKIHSNSIRKILNIPTNEKNLLITASSDNSIKAVDLRANQIAFRFDNTQNSGMMDIACLNDSLFAVDTTGSIKELSLKMLSEKNTAKTIVNQVKTAHRGVITSALLHKGLLFTGGGADKVVKVWDISKSLKLLHTLNLQDGVFALTGLQ